MADSKQNINVTTSGSVNVNVKAEQKSSNSDIIRNQKATVSTNAMTKESAIPNTTAKTNQRVDVGGFQNTNVNAEFTSVSRSILSQLSATLTDKLDPVYKGVQDAADSLEKNVSSALKKLADESKKDESKKDEEAEKRRKELLAEIEEERRAATDEAVSALKAYDENLKNKTNILSDTAMAVASSSYKSSQIGGLDRASATLALGAINPVLGSLSQMLLSKDGVGPYVQSMFSSMLSFTKKEANKTLKNIEIEDRVTKALRNSAINVEELLKKTKDLKNIDVKSLVKGNSSNKKNIDLFAEQKTLSDQTIVQTQQQNFISRFTNSVGNMFRSLMPSKKLGAEAAHEKTMTDMFARKVATNSTETVVKSNAWSEIFGLLKKGLLSTLGLVAIYFSGDQFKAWLKDFITTPFKNLANSIVDGTFSFENNWKDLVKAVGITFVGIKGILGNISTLSAIIKLIAKGSGLGGAALFAGLTAYHGYKFKKALDEKDMFGMLEHGILGVGDAVAVFVPQMRILMGIVEALNFALKWYLDRKLEEEKRKHQEAVNKSLGDVRSDAAMMKGITQATRKDISVDEFADMKRRNLTKEQMIEEVNKKDSPVLSDARLDSAIKAYDHGLLYSKFNQIAFNEFGSQGLDALKKLYNSDKISDEDKKLLKAVIDDETIMHNNNLSARDYFDAPVVVAENLQKTSALNINQTSQELMNNVTGQTANYVPKVQVPTSVITAEMVRTAPENTQVINDKFCTIENLLVELNNSLLTVNNSIQTKKSASVGGIPSTSTTIAATGR